MSCMTEEELIYCCYLLSLFMKLIYTTKVDWRLNKEEDCQCNVLYRKGQSNMHEIFDYLVTIVLQKQIHFRGTVFGCACAYESKGKLWAMCVLLIT